METSPYRAPAGPPQPPNEERAAPRELVWMGLVFWLATAVRVGFGVARVESSRELGLAWLMLLVTPVLAWQELVATRPRGA